MKRLLGKVCALALCLVFCASACAEGLTDALGGYLDTGDDLRFALSAQLESLVPYGEETIGMLNGVLKHVSAAVVLRDEETAMDFCVAGDSVAAMKEQNVQGGTELTTPLLPNRTLQSSGSVLDKLGGTAESEPKFDLLKAISEWEACYQTLTDAIIPYAEEKKASYTIEKIGASRWSRIARLTPEQGQEIAPLIEKVLACGMDEAFAETLKGLSTSKGFIVGLYQTKEGGEDLALYMKGTLTFADGLARTLAFQWAFAEKEGVRTDTVKYELLQSKKAVDTRTIRATLKRRADDELLLKGDCSAAIKDADGNITTTHTYDLSGKARDGVRPVTGSVVTAVKTREGETTTTDTTTITPDVKLTTADGSSVLSGSVRLEKQTGKNVHTALNLLFDEEPAQLLEGGRFFEVEDRAVMPESSLTQNMAPDSPDDYLVGEPPIGLASYEVPAQMQTVDADDPAALESAMGEMAQQLAGRLLIALVKIPPEDAALIRDNLSQEDYQTFVGLVEGLGAR